jgi:hypothetical protein
MIKSRIAASLLTLCAFASMAPAAFASDGTSVLVSSGSLSISNPAADDFTAVTLNGSSQTTTAPLAGFTATDARGTGAGWHVTAQATQFAGGGFTLPTGSLLLSAPTVAAAVGTTSPNPTIVTGPYTIDTVGASQIASAALDEGMGTYNFSATTLTLAVSASAHAATYLSTVTISQITAP